MCAQNQRYGNSGNRREQRFDSNYDSDYRTGGWQRRSASSQEEERRNTLAGESRRNDYRYGENRDRRRYEQQDYTGRNRNQGRSNASGSSGTSWNNRDRNRDKDDEGYNYGSERNYAGRDRNRYRNTETDAGQYAGDGRRSRRGFAAMDKTEVRRIAAKGGRASHANGGRNRG